MAFILLFAFIKSLKTIGIRPWIYGELTASRTASTKSCSEGDVNQPFLATFLPFTNTESSPIPPLTNSASEPNCSLTISATRAAF